MPSIGLDVFKNWQLSCPYWELGVEPRFFESKDISIVSISNTLSRHLKKVKNKTVVSNLASIRTGQFREGSEEERETDERKG
jgi:hypothetical protein